MIFEGLALTVVGMSVVFGFLALMVLVMMFSSFIIQRYFPEKGAPKSSLPPGQGGSRAEEEEIAVAIAAATWFRNNR